MNNLFLLLMLYCCQIIFELLKVVLSCRCEAIDW